MVDKQGTVSEAETAPSARWAKVVFEKGKPFTAAFRLFRNYDGKGGAFGGVSASALSSDNENASIYASFNYAGGPRPLSRFSVPKA
jgi:hypothetical protein